MENKEGALMRRWKGMFRLRIVRKGRVTYNSTEWYKNEKDLISALRHDIKELAKVIERYDKKGKS